MIKAHNTFDPLNELIIGDVNIKTIKLDDPRRQKRIEYIFQKTKEELAAFQQILESKGIVVHRPTPMRNVPIQTPRLPANTQITGRLASAAGSSVAIISVFYHTY